jgi:O-antigen/teichoic acid export membrane protein
MSASTWSRLRSLLPTNTAQLWYVPIATLAMALMFARLLVYAAQMPTSEYASLSAGFLVSGLVSVLASLGLQPLAQREMPGMLVKQRSRAAVVLLTQAILVSLALTVVGVAATAVGVGWPALSPASAMVAFLHGLAQQVFLLCTIESRSRGSAVQFGWQSLARAVVVMASGWLAARQMHSAMATLVAEGTVCGLVDAWLLKGIFERGRLHAMTAIRLALRRMRGQRWSAAVVMLLAGMVSYVATNVDRWLAGSMLDREAFANYSFGWVVLLAGMQAQVIVNSAAFPWLARRAASRGQSSALASSAVLSILVLACAAIVAVPGTVAARALVPRHWPAFVASIDLIPVFALCAVLRLGDFWSSYLLVAGHERLLLRVTLVATIGSSLAWWLAFGRYWQPLTAHRMAMLPLFLTLATYLASVLASLLMARRP